MFPGDFRSNLSRIAQNFHIISNQNTIQMFCPILHCHRNMPFGAPFRQVQISVDDASQIFQFIFFQIVLGNDNVCFYNFPVWRIFPWYQPHMLPSCIGPLHNQFGGSMSVNSIMQFVLYFCKKLPCGRRIGIVIHAGCVNICDFLIKTSLTQPYFPDFRQQMFEIISV